MNLPKSFLLLLLVLFIHASSFGQKKTISGIITDSISKQVLGWASIKNVITGTTSISKTNGSFFADVSEGQILAFSANGFFTDTLTINAAIWEKGIILIRLKPLPSTLADVVVMGSYNNYQNDSLARRRYFLQTVGENKMPVLGRPNESKDFGVAINLDHFGKTEKRKLKARSLFEVTEEEAYINYRWNDTLVAKYTDFKGDDLTSFMQANRPKYAWLRKHVSEEDLLYYINTQLKKRKNS